MTWTQPNEFKFQIQKWWDRGDLLIEVINGQSTFPRKLKFRGPSSSEMSTHFEEVRNWIASINKVRGIRIVNKEVNHRIVGRNVFPSEAFVDTLEDALQIVGKQNAAAKFCNLCKGTNNSHPELLEWVKRRPLQALELSESWQHILAVISWMKENQRPDIYLRQVDLPGIHSKFIEHHRSTLLELLDLALPSQAFDTSAGGIKLFAQRYGFKEKPVLIRFRILDQAHSILGGNNEDITLDLVTLARLSTNTSHVFIVENEINYLAFPPLQNSMVIFGAGYGLQFLSKIPWLQTANILYWGDIDTHGYAILNSARAHLPHLKSVLMDETTFLHHRSSWGFEKDPHPAKILPLLNAEELEMYRALKSQQWGSNLRLEQEHVNWGYAERNLNEYLK